MSKRFCTKPAMPSMRWRRAKKICWPIATLWHRQLHIFIHAFYYIEYGIAQLGALQVWANSRRDQAAALSKYKNALQLGGSRKLPELFSAAGCKFQFDPPTMRPLIQTLR